MREVTHSLIIIFFHMFILINIYRSLTLFMVVFTNEALGYETHTQRWRHKTDMREANCQKQNRHRLSSRTSNWLRKQQLEQPTSRYASSGILPALWITFKTLSGSTPHETHHNVRSSGGVFKVSTVEAWVWRWRHFSIRTLQLWNDLSDSF